LVWYGLHLNYPDFPNLGSNVVATLWLKASSHVELVIHLLPLQVHLPPIFYFHKTHFIWRQVSKKNVSFMNEKL
jgi:hypothetical protein